MPLSHTCTDGATENSDHLDQILSDLGTELRRLSERAPAEQDFEPSRVSCRSWRSPSALCWRMSWSNVDRPAVTIDAALDGDLHQCSGSVTVLRTLYRAGCEPAVVPLELRAGIIEGHWTPRAAHQASYLVAHLTPQEAADTLREST